MRKRTLLLISILITIFSIISSGALASSKLDIDKVIIKDGDKQIFSGTSGTFNTDADTELDFEVKVENLWDRDANDRQDITRIVLDAVLYDSDDDITYSSSEFELRPEGYKTIRFEIDIPEDIDDDRNYDFEITVRGYDENDTIQEDDANLEMELSQGEDIVFNDLNIDDPSPCSDYAKITAELENKGNSDEDVTITVDNDYGGTLFEKTLEIERDDTIEFTRTFDVTNLPSGRYNAEVYAEYNGKETSKTASFYVPECDERDAAYDTPRQTTDRSRQSDWDPTEYDMADSDLTPSRNRAYFQTIDNPQSVEVVAKEMTYVPRVPVEKKTDYGFIMLAVIDFLLLVIVIVVAVVVVTNKLNI